MASPDTVNSAVAGAPLLELRGITKRFPGVVANDRASLSVAAGEVHAILGENGAGKSTLMRILYGAYQPDEGAVVIEGAHQAFESQRKAIACGVGMIHQEFMLVQPMTVVENVILGLPGRRLALAEAAARVAELSDRHGLDVDPWARVQDLPVGVQQRVEILKLLYRDARILVLDEPTAILTPQEADSLLATLRHLAGQGRAVIIVTHKLNEVMAVADKVTIMRDGRTVCSLAPSQTDMGELARLMVGRPVERTVEKPCVTPGPTILTVSDLHVSDAAGLASVRGIDLTVRAGEIVGIAGVEGNGQSHLVEAVTACGPVPRGGCASGVRTSPMPRPLPMRATAWSMCRPTGATSGPSPASVSRTTRPWEATRTSPRASACSATAGKAAPMPRGWSSVSGSRPPMSGSRRASCPAATCKRSSWAAKFCAIPACWWSNSRRAGWISGQSNTCGSSFWRCGPRGRGSCWCLPN